MGAEKADPGENQNTRLSVTPPPGTASTPWAGAYPVGNEIDLVDLGVMLWRRWRLMLAVFLIVVVLAILAAIFKSPTYQYSTTLKLSTVVSSNGSVIPLLPAANVEQALQGTHIPNAINQYETENHTDVSSLKVDVSTSVTAGSSTVVLSCIAKMSRSQACIAVEKMAAEAFIEADSQAAMTAKNTLANLHVQALVLQSNADKLNTSVALYQKQAQELQKHIEAVSKVDINSTKNATQSENTLSNLLLSTQVQQSVDKLNTILQTLTVTIPGQQATLAQQIADNKQAQIMQQQVIALSTNRILSAGLRSLQPVGLRRSAIVALGIVIGFFLALFAAILANYFEQVRMRLSHPTRV
ncbi:MAG: Wzz/FepE/Etk N-terminal domain-containing protein [Gammaproteobacteria bacterium]